MKIDEVVLKSGESVEYDAEVSKKALLVTWLAIPAFIFVPSMVAYIPRLIKSLVVDGIKNALFGDSLPSFPTLWSVIPEEVGAFVRILIAIPIVLAAIVWLCVCLALTKRHFKNSLIVTNYRVIGESVDGVMEEELANVKNVCLEQSFLGRIFNYGAIVISGKRQSLTIKNIDNPRAVYQMLLSHAENYCAS